MCTFSFPSLYGRKSRKKDWQLMFRKQSYSIFPWVLAINQVSLTCAMNEQKGRRHIRWFWEPCPRFHKQLCEGRWKEPVLPPFNVPSKHSSDSSSCFKFMPNPKYLPCGLPSFPAYTRTYRITCLQVSLTWSSVDPTALRKLTNQELDFLDGNLVDWQKNKNNDLCPGKP